MRICEVKDCGRRHEALGLCRLHYRRTEAQKDASRILASKRDKEAERERARSHGAARRADPARAEELKAYKRLLYRENPEPTKQAMRFRNTGWSHERLLAARAGQRGECAICPRIMQTGNRGALTECCDHYETVGGARVDTGTPGASKHTRGLLCGACNTGLGYYEKFQRPAGLRIDVYDVYIDCYEHYQEHKA